LYEHRSYCPYSYKMLNAFTDKKIDFIFVGKGSGMHLVVALPDEERKGTMWEGDSFDRFIDSGYAIDKNGWKKIGGA